MEANWMPNCVSPSQIKRMTLPGSMVRNAAVKRMNRSGEATGVSPQASAVQSVWSVSLDSELEYCSNMLVTKVSLREGLAEQELLGPEVFYGVAEFGGFFEFKFFG